MEIVNRDTRTETFEFHSAIAVSKDKATVYACIAIRFVFHSYIKNTFLVLTKRYFARGSTGVIFCTPPFSSAHRGRTQTKCPFVPQGAYRNGASIYICTCGVVEYRTSENVTPEFVCIEFGCRVKLFVPAVIVVLSSSIHFRDESD